MASPSADADAEKPRLPAPPSSFDEAEQRAWYAGAAAVANILGQQAGIIADVYNREAAAGDGTDDTNSTINTNARDDADEDVCDDCGGDLIDAFGGAVCPTCDHSD